MTDRVDTLTIYRGTGGWRAHDVGVHRWVDGDGWRWQLQAPNNRIIGASSEAYRRRADCISNAARVLDLRDTSLMLRRGEVNRLWQPHLRVVVKP